MNRLSKYFIAALMLSAILLSGMQAKAQRRGTLASEQKKSDSLTKMPEEFLSHQLSFDSAGNRGLMTLTFIRDQVPENFRRIYALDSITFFMKDVVFGRSADSRDTLCFSANSRDSCKWIFYFLFDRDHYDMLLHKQIDKIELIARGREEIIYLLGEDKKRFMLK